MKNVKKLLSVIGIICMLFALAAPVSADTTGTITITPPTGVDAEATNTYKIYKVFDAVGNNTSISYKLVSSKTTAPAGFTVDESGNVTYSGSSTSNELTAADIAAIAAYVTESDLVDTVTTTGTTAETSKALPNGYYYITTTTGTVVTIDSTNPNATVNDKNTVPTVDKTITGASSVDDDGKKALAQVGTVVYYSSVITIGKGAKGYIFHDTMETGLSYNNDAAITGVAATNYSVGKSGTDTFTITINDDYIKTLAVGSELTVTYSATVTTDAITTDPLNNTCYVSYGDATSNNRTPDSEADVYEAKFTVTKKKQDDSPLAGAGFVLTKKVGDTVYYYKKTVTDNKPVVSWVDTLTDATEYTSDAQGQVTSFTGLASGKYTLVENTVPGGYNKAADITFTIAEHNYTEANLEQAATVTNVPGSTLPSTGGIGTTVFHVGGALLAIGAGVLLISKKIMKNQ